eukprot:TRINITY_DN9598_c0_g1_i1.p1 TRINITY_DN9598_c0_g1~~TRINITY_DN9598_c0_g1_i1.p1  ORF type:complete len:263 (+),score=79.79 TRINITY_DN9598_c0_g1_i1:119-907(+)
MAELTEDQMMELEALKSIYPTEFVESPDSPASFAIELQPIHDDANEGHVLIRMEVTLPAEYPNVVPSIELIPVKGLTASTCRGIKSTVDNLATENIGMPMIFTLASAVQEWLATCHDEQVELLEKQRAEEEAAREAERLAALEAEYNETMRRREEELRKQTEGTMVTVENFLEWKKEFERKLEQQTKGKTKDRKGRLTGRQLFESAAGMSDDRLVAMLREEAAMLDEGDASESVVFDKHLAEALLEDDPNIDFDEELEDDDE